MGDQKKTIIPTWAGLLIIGAVIWVFIQIANPSSGESDKPAQPPTREETIKKLFSSWDGSHRELEAAIKKSMNDPDSYEHVETVYWDMKDHLVIRTTFRGKNAFGGVVKNWVKAKIDLNGKLLEIIEQGN